MTQCFQNSLQPTAVNIRNSQSHSMKKNEGIFKHCTSPLPLLLPVERNTVLQTLYSFIYSINELTWLFACIIWSLKQPENQEGGMSSLYRQRKQTSEELRNNNKKNLPTITPISNHLQGRDSKLNLSDSRASAVVKCHACFFLLLEVSLKRKSGR